MNMNSLFSQKPIIGMVHLLPLPGTPKYAQDIDPIIERALREAKIYNESGVDGMIIENFNDEPFPCQEISTEQIALMASITGQIQKESSIPIGINVHFNDWKAEMAIAFAGKAQFIRVEVFVDTVITASGIIQPCCAEVTRYRKVLGADEKIAIWADLHPKYSRNMIATTLEESAIMASQSLADAVIVTGETTGIVTPTDDIRRVKEVMDLPVIAGSGTNIKNVKKILSIADGAIVGSSFKQEGNVYNQVSEERVREFMATANKYK